MDYQNGWLKNFDVFFKMISLWCLWFRQLFDNSLHQWEVIPLFFFFNKTFSEHLKFHSNLDFSNVKCAKCVPSFYKSVFLDWNKFFYLNSCVPSCILNQVFLFIQINRKPFFYKKLSLNDIIFSIFDRNGVFKDWNTL